MQAYPGAAAAQVERSVPFNPSGFVHPSRTLMNSLEPALNIVKTSTKPVAETAQHVFIEKEGITAAVEKITLEKLNELVSPKAYNTEIHYVDDGPLTVQYLLVVDALNFCFWPEEELEYEQLSLGVKAALEEDPTALDAENLMWMDGEGAAKEIKDDWYELYPPTRVQYGEDDRPPWCYGRDRRLTVLLPKFFELYARRPRGARGSALTLMQLVAQLFPGFRDHAIYKGQQVFLYKRAQIFVGDVYGAFRGQGLGMFWLTMFADYRVPVVLRTMGVLRYSQQLEDKIQRREQIPAGSEEEVEIRACTVVAVEQLREAIAAKFLGTAGAQLPHAIQLDWPNACGVFDGGPAKVTYVVFGHLSECRAGLWPMFVSFLAVFGVSKAFSNLSVALLSRLVGYKLTELAGWVGLCWSVTVLALILLMPGSRSGLASGLNETLGYVAVAAAAPVYGLLEPLAVSLAWGLLLAWARDDPALRVPGPGRNLLASAYSFLKEVEARRSTAYGYLMLASCLMGAGAVA
eukprot:XP_001692426.1 predicted protein [Chlamydomonas reinhardtii]